MRPGRFLAVLVLLGALTACSPPAVDAPSPSPTASPTPTLPAPSTLTTGSVSLTIQPLDPAGVATQTPVDDGSVRVTAGEALLTAPAGATFRALDDGSAVVEDAAGLFLAGLTADAPGARLVQQDPTSVRLTGVLPAGLWITSVAVQDAAWGRAEGGRSLAVTPSAWARAGGAAAQDGLWSQLVALAPDADTPSMRAQLECHELGAPDKDTWNLEPWRPDVSALDMIAARCNPA